MRNKAKLLAALAVVLLVGISPLAADTVIRRGIDVFTTTSDGSTHYSFAKNPIPAGFFCKRSEAFTGRVALKGLPLETGVPGSSAVPTRSWSGSMTPSSTPKAPP
jgi:hypothetical protein